MMAHQFKEPTRLAELNPQIPAELIEVVERLMQKAPEARFGSTAELVEALRPLAAESAPAPRAVGKPQGRSASAGGHAPAAAPRSVSPSTPTPKPQALESLPTRSSLRKGQPAPPPAPEPEEVHPVGKRVIPGADGEAESRGWDDRLGPVGIAVSALVACGLVYALAVWLQLF
jgi:hypothetical protein